MGKGNPTKFIFVLGGVMSGLGKGIAASSIGYLSKSYNFEIRSIFECRPRDYESLSAW